MEELQARHRKEQRDLVAKVTQKKKQATKKTRKGINDECAQIELELKQRQAQELAELNGDAETTDVTLDTHDDVDDLAPDSAQKTLDSKIENLSLDDQLSLNGSNTAPGDGVQSKKPNRAKARLAKRAAEQEAMRAEAAGEAANMPDQKEVERKKMLEEFTRRRLTEKVIRADGHCLYSAVADQLTAQELGLQPRVQPVSALKKPEEELPAYKTVRYAAAEYMQQYPDEFVPFLEEPLDDYLYKIRDTGEWGGQLELLALAKTYGVDIHVIQGDGRTEQIRGATNAEDTKDIWLAYYRHNFGLGEHYNSLRKVP